MTLSVEKMIVPTVSSNSKQIPLEIIKKIAEFVNIKSKTFKLKRNMGYLCWTFRAMYINYASYLGLSFQELLDEGNEQIVRILSLELVSDSRIRYHQTVKEMEKELDEEYLAEMNALGGYGNQ